MAEKTDLFSLMLFGKLIVSGQIYTPVALWVRDPTSEFTHPARIHCSTHKGFLSGKQTLIITEPSHLIFYTRPVEVCMVRWCVGVGWWQGTSSCDREKK